MSRFDPISNVILVCANSPHQAESIVTFLNCHADDLGCNSSFYVRDECVVCAASIKPTRIDYILGVVKGFLLSK